MKKKAVYTWCIRSPAAYAANLYSKSPFIGSLHTILQPTFAVKSISGPWAGCSYSHNRSLWVQPAKPYGATGLTPNPHLHHQFLRKTGNVSPGPRRILLQKDCTQGPLFIKGLWTWAGSNRRPNRYCTGMHNKSSKNSGYLPFIFLYFSKGILPLTYKDVAWSTGFLFRPALRLPFFFCVFMTLNYWFYVMVTSFFKVSCGRRIRTDDLEFMRLPS